MSTNKINLERIRDLLKGESRNIVLLSHRNPDGDAIGSTLALYNLFLKMGHKVSVLLPNAFPSFLRWMKNANKIIIYERQEHKADKELSAAEIVFALDFNDLNRIKEFHDKLSSDSVKILIDHHPGPTDFADYSISDTRVSSTAELIFTFIHDIGYGDLIDKDIAGCIYAGIMTDTGCFSYNSSLPETYQIVASILEKGIDKDAIYHKTYNNYSSDRMQLMGYCLDKKMVILPEYRTAYISLTQEELRKYNFKIGDSEGFVNLPLSIKGIDFSVLLIEKSDMVRLSFRSRSNFAVNTIASDHFNGGGHKNAAGGESYVSIEETIEKLVSLLPNYINALLPE